MIFQGTPFASILSMARTSETLVASNVHPVLVLVSEIRPEPSAVFTTQKETEIDSLAVQQHAAIRQIPALGLVFFVRKRESGLVLDRIGIGRDQNVDICVRNNKMSRYHAFFSMTPENDWMITDANSKNGSRVGGTRLAAGASCVLPETTSISLGGVQFSFYLPANFITLCQSFLSRDSNPASGGES
jgi:hypothetical protein